MEPNPQTINYMPYFLTGVTALTAAVISTTYFLLRKFDQLYQRNIEDQATREATESNTKLVLRAWYIAVDRNFPTDLPPEVRAAAKRVFRRTPELEQRLRPERLTELLTSIENRTN